MEKTCFRTLLEGNAQFISTVLWSDLNPLFTLRYTQQLLEKTLHIPFTENIVKSPLIPEIRIKTPSVNIFMTIERIYHVKFLFFTKFKQPKAIFSLVESGSWLLPTNAHLSGSQSLPTVPLKSPPTISLKLGCSNLISLTLRNLGFF